MLFAIAQELKDALVTKGCPVSVVYGPERKDQALNHPRFVIERDRTAGDKHTGARSQRANPRQVDTRAIGCVCRMFAKSSIEGAGVWNHERDADQMVDHFTVQMTSIVQMRHTLWRITSAKFMTADELAFAGLETWPGVVYEIKFEIDRGVADVTWRTPDQSAGSAQAEITMGSGELSTTVKVRTDGGSTWEVVT
jgi:hypothetical protein